MRTTLAVFLFFANFLTTPVHGFFVKMNSGVNNTLLGIWGDSPTNVFAVGTGGVILHYDGNASYSWWNHWGPQANVDLHTIVGIPGTPHFTYAIGGAISPRQDSVVLRFIAFNQSWSPLPSVPSFPIVDAWLDEEGNIFCVGGAFVLNFYFPAIAVYRNGVWEEMWMQDPGRRFVAAVTGSGPRDVYALLSGDTSIIYRYDGNTLVQPPQDGNGIGRWTPYGSPFGGLSSASFDYYNDAILGHHYLRIEVDAFSRSGFRIYTVAQQGGLTNYTIPSVNAVLSRPRAAWAAAGNDIYVVGSNDAGVAKMAAFNGESWRNETVPITDAGTGLRAVWGKAYPGYYNHVFAAGAGGTIVYGQADPPVAIIVENTKTVETDALQNFLTFNVRLSRPSADFVEVSAYTRSQFADLTATPNVDYKDIDVFIEFAPGETNKQVLVPILGDNIPEADEQFALYLYEPSNATILFESAYGVILDDDQFFDFGDAPDGLTEPNYPTLLAHDGARHHLIGLSPRLGEEVDDDSGLLENSLALADDTDGDEDDEDGITFLNSFSPGSTIQLQATVIIAGKLDAWIDFNADGDWDDPAERILTNAPAADGTNLFSFLVPTNAVFGTAYARFRISSNGVNTPSGFAPDGEVEDYAITIAGPELKVAAATAATLTLQWPAAATAFILERTQTLTPPDWQSATGAIQVGENMNLVVDLTAATAFYRLRRPP